MQNRCRLTHISIVAEALSTADARRARRYFPRGHDVAMSSRSQRLRAARHDLTPPSRPVTKLSGPAETIAMIPYLLGFVPSESLVVIALEGPRRRLGPCIRLDLVSERAEVAVQAGYVRELVCQHGFDPVMVFAFSRLQDPADEVLRAVDAELQGAEVGVLESIRADGSRWWSLTCVNPLCCSPAGAPYDMDTSRVAAEAVFAGMRRAPDRDALRAQFEPLTPGRLRAVAEAATFLSPSRSPAPLVAASLEAPTSLTVGQIAALAVSVQSLSGRDEAWSLMSRATAEKHLDLWRVVMQSVPDELLPPVGGLTAFAAWLSGNGVLASHAAERVLQVDECYSMALLVVEALQSCLNPNTWEASVLRRSQTIGSC